MRPARKCRVQDCPRKHDSRGWCQMHYRRWLLAHPDLKPVSYYTAHKRVKDLHGDAGTHVCVDCGGPARDWSYNHDDPAELLNSRGNSYSLKPEHYSPRCRSCHKRFDRAVDKHPIPEPPIIRWTPSPNPSPTHSPA